MIGANIARARFSVSVVFLIHGLGVATWVSRIPAVQSGLHLSPSKLGATLMALGIGSLIAMPITGSLVDRWGSRLISILSTCAFCLGLIGIGFTHSAVELACALAFFGGSAGAMDVAMNAQAVELQDSTGRVMMSSFHALFSIGGMMGATLGGWIAAHGIAAREHFIAASVVLILSGLAVSGWMLPHQPHAATHSGSTGIRLNRYVLALGALGFCFFLNEGAMADWVAIYLRDSVGAGAGTAAAGYAAFSVGMTVMRLTGDWVTERLGPVRTVRLGALLGAFGIATALILGTTWSTFAGVAIAGLGFANIVPQVFSASGRIEGIPPGTSVASVTTASYFGLLSGPAIVGFLADWTTLRIALGLIVVLSLVGAALAPFVERAALPSASSYPEAQ